MKTILDIIGLGVVAIKSFDKQDSRPQYILFDDKKTIMEIVGQEYDPFTIREDEKFWELLFKDYPDSTNPEFY